MEKIISLAERGRTALLVIDPQERLMPAIYDADRVVSNIVFMMRCAEILEIPMLATTQYAKGIGYLVPEIAELYGSTECVDKKEFNAFANDKFKSRLKGLGSNIDTLLITGVEAHICIFQTAVGALASGYDVWIVSDAVSSRNPVHASDALAMSRKAGILTGPAEMLVYQMLERAGTQEFRSVLKYVK